MNALVDRLEREAQPAARDLLKAERARLRADLESIRQALPGASAQQVENVLLWDTLEAVSFPQDAAGQLWLAEQLIGQADLCAGELIGHSNVAQFTLAKGS